MQSLMKRNETLMQYIDREFGFVEYNADPYNTHWNQITQMKIDVMFKNGETKTVYARHPQIKNWVWIVEGGLDKNNIDIDQVEWIKVRGLLVHATTHSILIAKR